MSFLKTLFHKNDQQRHQELVDAIKDAVITLQPGRKYVLVIPFEGSDQEREDWTNIIKNSLNTEELDIQFVVVFAAWAKMIEFS